MLGAGNDKLTFRRRFGSAIKRLKQCENIVALSKDLGVHRRL